MSSIDQVKILFGFLHHVSSLSAIDASTNEDGFATEFYNLKEMSTQLKTNEKYNTAIGSLLVNKKKNRYKDILPFEQRRVELYPVEGEEGSEYINASYIADPLNKLSYIAAQGPNSYTVNDFWRMLWYHAIEVVVMACREIELGKSKCKQYWVAPGQVKHFGAITVTHVSDDNLSEDFIQRKMHIKCGEESQMLTQLHYTGWPDHGVPSNVKPILNIIKKFRAMVPFGNDVPIVIHCSAGCGRTGTLIGIDYAWSLLENKKFKTAKQVYEIVESMRKQRPAMVQTKDQYVLVYKVVFHLVRQYLEEYQHDPSVLHLFDAGVTENLAKIILPEYQNPSGLDEVATSTELGAEIEDDMSLSTPASPMRPLSQVEDPRPKPQLPSQKPYIPTKPDLVKNPLNRPKSPDSNRSVQSLDSIREPIVTPELKPANSDQALKPVFPLQKLLKPTIPQKRVSISENGLASRFALFEGKRPSLPENSLISRNKDLIAPTISKKSDQPLTNSLPLTSKSSLPISNNRNSDLNACLHAEFASKSNKPSDTPVSVPVPVPPLPTAKKVTSKQPSPTETENTKSISSISELLREASIDKHVISDDDEDDYWQTPSDLPVLTLQQQPTSNTDSIELNPKKNTENIELSSKKNSDSPPPLVPPRKSNSFTNLSTLGSSLGSIDAPPVPLKSMQDRELLGSMENIISPPPSSLTLAPILTVNPEDDYDEIGVISKEIAPLKPLDIYKAPRNEPIPTAAYLDKTPEKPSPPPTHAKPNPTAPYQSKSQKGMTHILSSLKKPEIFKQNKFLSQNISHAPNIPVQDTMVSTDQQRHLNKRGNIEYGPVGFGIRLTKPKGPRTIPKHWGNFAKESL